MNASQVRGALLEYLVRSLLINCGFIPVKADGLYTYESGGLFYVNGRGAAHDADVLMDPPVQMPFTYPTRLLFECKAYNTKTTLATIRNALGLRHDINEFEIVTRQSLAQRRNNRRAEYAIENRSRYNYQVGVACTKEYSKPAIEFAANNKIALLSLSWFLSPSIIGLFDSIDDGFASSVGEPLLSQVYRHLKDKSSDAESRHEEAWRFIQENQILGRIVRSLGDLRGTLFVGLIETGDIIFLNSKNRESASRLMETIGQGRLRSRLHYSEKLPELWDLSIYSDTPIQEPMEFDFFVPPRIMSIWREYNTSRAAALSIKTDYFSRMFIFNRSLQSDLPFFTINIDSNWLQEVRQAEDDLFRSDR